MRLSFHIIKLLKEKSGNQLRQPSDCENLSLDIESKTRVRIGATTLKRLLGFAHDERTPHASTLDAIAHYLGYAHWEELLLIEDGTVMIWYNGSLSQMGTSGGVEIWKGTGDICVVFPKNYNGPQMRVTSSGGTVQIQTLR